MPEAHDIVSHTMADFPSGELPAAVATCLTRYQRHLTELAAALLSAGQDEVSVRQSIESLFRSYQAELTSTIECLKGGHER